MAKSKIHLKRRLKTAARSKFRADGFGQVWFMGAVKGNGFLRLVDAAKRRKASWISPKGHGEVVKLARKEKD